ncbi:MAG TPA: GAF domain-containing protein, partial [Anaerolineae bacterium]|nr:GAF domain-containing protein [Anaerolineae bacterium]
LYENMLDVLQFQKLDELLQLIVVRAAEVLDAPYGEIMLLDHGELVDRAFTPNQTFLAGERVKPEEARLSWQAIQTRQPVILDDYATWPHRHPIYDQVPTHAVAVFPILKGDVCLGVFEFGRDQPDYIFSPEQIQRGHLFARLAALAINNDQVYAQMRIELEARKRAEENAQRQARELSLLHIIRTALAREVDLADLLRTVVEAIAGTLGYTHVSVYLQLGTVLRMQHQVGYQQPILEFPMTQGMMARCVRNATTIFLPDVRTDPEYIGAMDGLASEICVPLFEQHNAVGALNVESTIGHSLTQADVNLLNSVGDQVNIAIGRARLYSELRESERRYKDLVDNAQEIIYKTDLNGHFTFVNAAVTHLIGFSESELIGLHYLELILPDYRRAAARFYQRQLRSKTPSSYYEFPVKAKNGSIVWFGQNAQLILDPASGQVSGVQAVTRDITELHQTEAALRQHALELDTFAHTVAHDIKNPISAIIGFTDLLITDRESLPEDQIELSLHKINHSAWKMNRIVDEIM